MDWYAAFGISCCNSLNLGFMHADGWSLDPHGKSSSLPWLLSTLLSMHVADGLARVNSGFPTVIYQRGSVYDGQEGMRNGTLNDLDNLNKGDWIGMPLDSGFKGEYYADQARSNNASHNTEIMWEIRRFRYGYGFQIGVTVVLGTLALSAHAVMAIAHSAIIIGSRWGVSRAWGSISELIVLGWKSREVEGQLANTGAGIGTLRTWKKRVRIRARDTTIEHSQDGVVERKIELVPVEDAEGEINTDITKVRKNVAYS